MKLGVIPENLAERLAIRSLRMGIAPKKFRPCGQAMSIITNRLGCREETSRFNHFENP